MNVSKYDFLKHDQELKDEMKFLNRDEEGIFIDGALDPEKYYGSNIKILWVLKEAYGDVFSYPDFFVNDFDKFYDDIVCGVPRHTWGTIAEVSHNILNGFIMKTELVDILNKKEKSRESLSKIAFVNINKDTSYTGGRSENRNLEEAMIHYNKFLFKQIEHLNPNVIICGNSFQFLKSSFGFPSLIKKVNNIDYVDHYRIENKLILDPYHPGYLAYCKLDSMMYINDIVKTVRDCLQVVDI